MPIAAGDIKSFVDRLQKRIPSVAQLGMAVSLAARIEPELLRSARLELTPGLDASAEADLWFSPLIELRTADWLVLSPLIAQELQHRLAANKELLFASRELVKRLHKGAPATIILEEEISWITLLGAPNSTQVIEDRLRLVLGKLIEDPKANRSLVHWFAGAALRFPIEVKRTEAYTLLSFIVSALFDGRRIGGKDEPILSKLDELAGLMPSSVPKLRLYVGLTRNGIIIRPDLARGCVPIEVPRTNPVIIEIRSNYPERMIVTLARDEARVIEIKGDIIELHTATGDRYRLKSKIAEARPSPSNAQLSYLLQSSLLSSLDLNRKGGDTNYKYLPNDYYKQSQTFKVQTIITTFIATLRERNFILYALPNALNEAIK